MVSSSSVLVKLLESLYYVRQFENDFMPLFVGILPSVTAYKGIAGRAKVVQAFENYFRTDGHK